MTEKMQKFNKGDHVQLAKDLGRNMTHFQSDCEAIVMHTYDEKFGGDDIDSYCVYIKGGGETSWYKEHQLSLIEKNRIDLLDQWKSERKQEDEMKSDLDWIFDNGKDVLECADEATISALAKCFGMTNLWGSHGEGSTYFINAMATLEVSKPFLEAGDKDGWLNYCKGG